MNKYELLTEIAMLCDELEAYKRKAEAIERDIQTATSIKDGTSAGAADINPVDVFCLQTGRRKVFEDCIYTWRTNVTATRNDDGEIEYTPSFDKFCKGVYNHCPDLMSKREFFVYFDGEFRDEYEAQKAKALEYLLVSESEDEDDE